MTSTSNTCNCETRRMRRTIFLCIRKIAIADHDHRYWRICAQPNNQTNWLSVNYMICLNISCIFFSTSSSIGISASTQFVCFCVCWRNWPKALWLLNEMHVFVFVCGLRGTTNCKLFAYLKWKKKKKSPTDSTFPILLVLRWRWCLCFRAPWPWSLWRCWKLFESKTHTPKFACQPADTASSRVYSIRWAIITMVILVMFCHRSRILSNKRCGDHYHYYRCAVRVRVRNDMRFLLLLSSTYIGVLSWTCQNVARFLSMKPDIIANSSWFAMRWVRGGEEKPWCFRPRMIY